MALSISDTCEPKRVPRRRATVGTPYLARPKQRIQKRRLSLPLNKSVQFSELSEVCVFEPPPSKTWYTGEDNRRFKRERISDVMSFREQSRKKMGTNISLPCESSCCPVGIEQLLSNEAMIEARSNRKTAIQSVLSEQNRQRFFGVQDPLQIACLFVRFSAEASSQGLQRGKFQEMAKFV